MFQTNIVDVIKHSHFIFHKVHLISGRLWDNVEKYCRADGRQYGACALHAG